VREVVRRIDRDDAAAVDDDDALAGLRHLREDVRAQHDRVVAGQASNQIARFHDLFRVEPGGRLVEDQDFRVVDDGLREADALPVALRQLAAMPVLHVVHVGLLHRVVDAHGAFGLGRLVEFDLGDERQVLPDGHVRVERRRLGQVAGAAFGFERVGEDVETRHDGLALGCGHVAGDDPHGRGFPRAIRPEEPEDFAFLNAEADVVDCGHWPVPLGQVLDLNHEWNPVISGIKDGQADMCRRNGPRIVTKNDTGRHGVTPPQGPNPPGFSEPGVDI
jgi:hypothetical protein